MNAYLRISLAFVLLAGCSNSELPTGSSPPASKSAVPTVSPAESLEKCLNCANGDQLVPWFFIGNYLDARCTQPVIHASFDACQRVSLPATASLDLGEPLGTRKRYDHVDLGVGRQLSEMEAKNLYRKEGGACRPEKVTFKLAPLGCEGKRVCRDGFGQLSCGTCTRLPNGCPNFEGSRVYALGVVPK
jgi:hypothetical protein